MFFRKDEKIMKKATLTRLIRLVSPALLALLLMAAATACKDNRGDTQTEPESDTLPAVIETLPTTGEDTEPEQETEPAPSVSAEQFPSAAVPDYRQYTSAARIQSVLGAQKTYAVAIGADSCYKNGELTDGGEGVLARADDGSITVNGSALGALMGVSGIENGTPETVAKALGMGAAVYDRKLVLFYEGDEPLQSYEDIYTFEAMYLYMTGAAETELVNAFIDLPSRISNGTSNTVYYTAPDLNLGIQTSVYYAQMGQTNALLLGPSLVAGEGQNADNFTTVRIFNKQQTCITQFLAFDPAVKGGVQVAAAQVGEETLIATAAFADHDGADGDVRVFDAYGLLRMTVTVHEIMQGPYTIATGHFAAGVSDEVLLIATRTTDAEGKLYYVLINLSNGAVISEHALDCSFALNGDAKAGAAVNITVRNKGNADSVILYFPTVQAVYEGSAATGEFANANLNLPAETVAVNASNEFGEKYVISLAAVEGDENRSYITVYDENAVDGKKLDIAFRENRFFAAYYTDGYNDDRYVSQGTFCHIRTDLSNGVLGRLPGCATNEAVDNLFDTATYADYAFSDSQQYVNRLSSEYLFLEPCFTHRWNCIPHTRKLAEYLDPMTGDQKYVAVGKDGQYMDYVELGSAYYNGTYADGILDLAKFRLYPLRSFLQATAVGFRGENGNPEHLVGVSPVHEHEINVPGSVGDYNVYMIEGFRAYMLERYGSVENINRLFGTSFTDRADMDAPRDLGRGDWDAYKGDYFTEWSMYNRYIVSKRIMEAYREALLAGYPPEAISAHQIPEGEAVSGFLGDASTRLTPIDVVLTCGTAYGGTRYGYIINGSNFVRIANNIGHNSISIGEYSALQENGATAYKQLYTLWGMGVRMIHQITFNEAQANAEAEAIQMLEDLNEPRPGYTGGTTGSMGIKQGENTYRIIQIGNGEEKEGLLKSVDAEGKWEGTVYLVPFHTKVKVESIGALNTPTEGTANRFSTGVLDTIKNADQVEITFEAAYTGKGNAWVTFEVYHKDCLLGESVTTYQLTDTTTPYRYVLSNQLYESGLEVVITFHTDVGDGSMEGITLENMKGTLQTEAAAFTYYNGPRAFRSCVPHAGGVTFDVLDRDMKN